MGNGEYYESTETTCYFVWVVFVCVYKYMTANGNLFFGTSKEVLRVERLCVKELLLYVVQMIVTPEKWGKII